MLVKNNIKKIQRDLMINFPRNLKNVSTVLDLFSLLQINKIFPKK